MLTARLVQLAAVALVALSASWLTYKVTMHSVEKDRRAAAEKAIQSTAKTHKSVAEALNEVDKGNVDLDDALCDKGWLVDCVGAPAGTSVVQKVSPVSFVGTANPVPVEAVKAGDPAAHKGWLIVVVLDDQPVVADPTPPLPQRAVRPKPVKHVQPKPRHDGWVPEVRWPNVQFGPRGGPLK